MAQPESNQPVPVKEESKVNISPRNFPKYRKQVCQFTGLIPKKILSQ
jgi:hypothetical protein